MGVHTLQEMQLSLQDTMIQQALALTLGNRGRAALLLGISRQALHQRLRRTHHSDFHGVGGPHRPAPQRA